MKHLNLFIFLLISTMASSQIISQYVETDSGTTPKGLEIWNNTGSSIDFNVDNLNIEKGTNGAAPSLDYTINTGILMPGEVLIVGTIDMETVAIANGVLFYEKAFTFNGDDALVLKLGTTVTDVFGEPGIDPGASWNGNGVSTQNQNIALLSGINIGELVGFTDPSTRFETISTTPTGTNGLDGFGIAPQPAQVELAFVESIVSVDENGGSINIAVSPSAAPTNSLSVDVSIMMGGTATESSDFTFSTTTLNFPSGSTAAQTINIPIIDNATDDSSVFFVLELTNPVGASLGNSVLPVYILDDDNQVPATDNTVLDINYLTSYTVDPSGTAEIVKFDAATQRLYVVNDTKIEIIDLSNPTVPSTIGNIDVTTFGSGAQSMDVKNGIVAIAVSANVKTDNGIVLFTDVNGNNAVQVQVGALPDMLTFTPDGNSVIVANEGEPNSDYTIDPEGSISVIDVTGGLSGITQANVTNINFNTFDSQQATLVANGVRIYGPGATVSQDLEPEFITVTGDSQTAYVALQENNAYAIINLTTNTIVEIKSFGLKDHSLPENTLDVSDETNFIFDASWPIKGMYMPDGITTYNLSGVNYLVTANEGDSREYVTFEEERKITDADYVLDPAVFQNIDILELESNLSEINVTTGSGDSNGDGLYEEIHIFGGRSFSIFNADTGVLIYDSGNDFAHITAADPTYGPIFNTSNSNNSFKNRSDNKGVEPENVIIQEIDGNYYAFVILERIGGVMAYDVTNPNAPVFLEYENSRGAVPGAATSGDLGPEGIVYIAPEDSGTGKALLVISNEVSATLSIFELSNIILSNPDFAFDNSDFKVYPNPVDALLEINEIGDYTVYDLTGKIILQEQNTSKVDVQNLSKGVYIIKNEQGNSLKFIKR